MADANYYQAHYTDEQRLRFEAEEATKQVRITGKRQLWGFGIAVVPPAVYGIYKLVQGIF